MNRKLDRNVIQEIEKMLENLPKDKSYVVYDGIVNMDKYEIVNKRIMWVMKEAFSDGNDTDNWTILNKISNRTEWEYKGGKNSYKNMVLATYAILHDREITEEEYNSNFWQEQFSILHHVAYINVKKHLGKSSSKYGNIKKSYNANRDLLHKQLEASKPDIVIFGSTFSYFKKELQGAKNINGEKWKWEALGFKNRGFYYHDNTLYVDAFHPELRSVKAKDKPEYVNSILRAVRKYFTK